MGPIDSRLRSADQAGNEAEELIDRLVNWLNAQSIREVLRAGLHEVLTLVVNRTHDIGDAIRRTYFDVRWQPPRKDAAELEVGAYV
jgi:uncharacterized alpha-E superfamily protein